ncbi:uncharacterized protein BX663DRAFT_443130 [Cokeromyces recurvatus]|uniref:uncharacterized protein n=1 Tax=Cokeromyces recurvatus TaxID=90255 RepID=UPI0022205446|nr:uncharacterized protein BX663DRAFT_443130 [Cokeromyces recurvatus]KAI7898426.1 hypothetical protein BX663DRAFT_443130 [Cokeromyces recurvatus]
MTDEYGFETRLRYLEHILLGQQQQQQKDVDENILKRIQALLKNMDAVYKTNKSIKDFITKYDMHANILNPSNSSFALEREVLAPDVKLELVLCAQQDLEKFANEVKQVKDLEYVVSGKRFDVIESLAPQLSTLEVKHEKQIDKVNELTRQITDFMERYNGMVNTLSEIFISWDHILTNIETHVSTLERNNSEL